MSGERSQTDVERLVATARQIASGRWWGGRTDDMLELQAAVEVFNDPPAPTIASAWRLVKGAAQLAGGVDLSIERVEEALVADWSTKVATGIPLRGEKWASGHTRADCCDGAMAHHANLYTIWQDPEKGPLGLNPTPSGEEKQPLTPTEILATRRLQRETTSVDPKKPPQGESS